MKKPPDDIIVLALRAISGEITPNMRMIAFGYGGDSATFRFYMADEPSDDELEIGEIVAVNFDSGHPTDLKMLDVDFVVTDKPLGKLDTLGFGIFRRWEELQ